MPEPTPAYVIFADGTRVDVEVADTGDSRARGLMFRGALGEREGMLFRRDRRPGLKPSVYVSMVFFFPNSHARPMLRR
ncbi:MAG: DUF192 domain-containing protein [Geminicoccales bacterium]